VRCPDYPPELGESRLLTDDELRASLESTLRDWDRTSDLWLFGYGSLIWNPGLPTVEALRSKVHGYHRGLYLWSRVNRGTPEQPGLVLALDRGGSCTGMAFRLAAEGSMPHLEALWRREMPMGSYRPAWLPCVLALDRGGSCTGMAFRLAAEGSMPHLEALWRREMPMGSYRPAWLPCVLADGRRVDALAFVMRRDVPSYTGKLRDDIIQTVLGCACGRYGTTFDYVSRTVHALRESGMPDRALEALLARCKPAV
jgi:cation transport protein ChaC